MPAFLPPRRREIWAWAMYDFANSGYTTVVLTAVFNAYFVGVVAATTGQGRATFIWTIAVAVANGVVLLVAPVVGAIADHAAAKKPFLAVTTIGCVVGTALLSLVGPGDIWLGMGLIVFSSIMFSAGENIIAAFLPEISAPEDMGRISAYGWSLGYLGGLLVLGVSLGYVILAQERGEAAHIYVPVVMWIVAIAFGFAALPTFLVLKERAQPSVQSHSGSYLRLGWRRVRQTLIQVRHYRDLFWFLLALTVYSCGIYTVIVLAAIYAQQVIGFTTSESMILILVVNLTAALGAYIFGQVQDRLGSIVTLSFTLAIWIVAIVIAYLSHQPGPFWVAANLVGLALGASQSAGRALIGQFTPAERSAEFFGLWGMAVKVAAIIGPISYGVISMASGGDHRIAILSTLSFFVVGLVLLRLVNEHRGREAATAPL